MGIKSIIAKPLAALAAANITKWSMKPVETQKSVFDMLISQAKHTAFGKDHHFEDIKTYEDFKQHVPIQDYEGLKPYIERTLKAEANVLWPGLPIYFCKTSGTTSGTKYIPITGSSIPNHIDSAKNALLSYIHHSGNSAFVDGKMMFLQGSPILKKQNGIPVGRLSGIVAHHVPAYLQKNRLPDMQTNSIEDWETKVEAISKLTLKHDMRLISGIPSWVQMYFERVLQLSGKKHVKDVFPNFSLFVYGGVNFEPYRPIFEDLIGKKVHSVETYPASEGFIAFQNDFQDKGLLLVLDKGIYYEFIPADEYFNENPTRLSIAEVQLGVNYAIILNTNAGLWGYSIGDTVKFTSLFPHKIVVTGRIKHFTSAFGEHVIAEEVENSMAQAMQRHGGRIAEFHVAPEIKPKEGLPYHEWLIEFEEAPSDLNLFTETLNELMQQQNIYYKDLIVGKVLQPLKITVLNKGAFQRMMKSRGKLGGQNKVPRLSNDREVADLLKTA